MVPNLANIAKITCFPKKWTTFCHFVCLPKFAIFWNNNYRYWQNNPFWMICQMYTENLERKYSWTLIVVNLLHVHQIICLCSSAVAATCDALSITSLVARKLQGASFSLVRKCAGKPLLQWWRCGARRGRELETASCAKAYGPRTRLRLWEH